MPRNVDPDHRCELCAPGGVPLTPETVPAEPGKCGGERWPLITRGDYGGPKHFVGRCRRDPLRGGTTCIKHGGSAPQVRAAAARRLDTARIEADRDAILAAEGAGPIEDPVEALAELTTEVLALKRALGARVNALTEFSTTDEKGTEQLRATVAAYERALDRSGKFLEVLAKLGYAERMVRLSESQGDLLAQVIRRLLGDLELTPEQEAKAAEAVPRRLLEVVA